MTEIPLDELGTMPMPHWFQGKKVLELGNKKNQSGLYRDWYVANGAEYKCIDWNAEDGAIPMDMGTDLNAQGQGKYYGWADIVTNFGFTEHVFTDQVQCWYNVLALAGKMGCQLAIVLPFPTHWDHHGVYQPTLDWIEQLLKRNGFGIQNTGTNKNRKRWVNCVGAVRVEEYVGFQWPDDYLTTGRDGKPLNGIYITPPERRVNKAEKNCGIKP